MKPIFYLVLFTLFASAECSFGIPPAIAKEILKHRGSDFDLVDGIDFGMLSDPIIKGTDQIRYQTIKVGNPAIALNVLIVSPRDYGFKVSGKVDITKEKEMSFQFIIKSSSTGIGSDEAPLKRILSADRLKQYNATEGKDFEATETESLRTFEEFARMGGLSPAPAKSKTVFFLNGFGVSNRLSLPWALILAKHGYQVIAPDLRGMGKSGGKGPTYGKLESEDLKQLLTRLRSSGQITEEGVGVIGISYGAGIASLWSAQDPRVKTTILIAPYAQADETMIRFADKCKDNLKFPFVINSKFVRKGTKIAARKLKVTWEDLAPAKAIPTIRHPILFLTSSADEIIPASVVKKLHQTAPKGSSIKSFKHIPHMILGYNIDEAEPAILDWLKKYLPVDDE